MSKIKDDCQLALNILSELDSTVKDIKRGVAVLRKKTKNGDLNTSKGISFLDVKNHQLLTYQINLAHLMYQKSSGQSIKDVPDVERLVEIRTVLEKMRPIEQKLKYQIDKLIHMATSETIQTNDPLHLRPNSNNLVSKFDERSDAISDNDESDGQVYRPVKLAPVHYDGDETTRSKQERQADKTKKRIANSSIIKDLSAALTDRPEEIRDSVQFQSARQNRNQQERTDYEEKYFCRMSLTRKEKNAEKRSLMTSGFDGITKFGRIGSAMSGGADDMNKKKRKKSSIKGSKRKRKFRK